ncbi:lysophospholipid acyltransferase family protein [Leptolyngbya sp. PCC 6406]|uniref:lysophospholipid acyltransferase family protein n=1 Tax=Leptolyngbya sp. PCC 6406 TaxID=1173264 RepID=UPI0002ACCA8E|nr:1-acyl-sn-glycerol-3-phosphate acyltransferase [Leptolyngbya sp. PCC 6406]
MLPTYFGRITISGQDNLPTQGPIILAPTHRSRWDSILLPMAVGRPVTGRDLHFMVTSDEVQGIQGWFIRRLGGFPVNTRHPTISSLRHGIDLMRRRAMLVIFPEGDIFRDGQIHRLKPGLARMAVQAESMPERLGVKIVPVGIHYSDPSVGWGTHVDVSIGKSLDVAAYLQDQLPCDGLKVAAAALTADLTIAITDVVASQRQAHQDSRKCAIAPSRH